MRSICLQDDKRLLHMAILRKRSILEEEKIKTIKRETQSRQECWVGHDDVGDSAVKMLFAHLSFFLFIKRKLAMQAYLTLASQERIFQLGKRAATSRACIHFQWMPSHTAVNDGRLPRQIYIGFRRRSGNLRSPVKSVSFLQNPEWAENYSKTGAWTCGFAERNRCNHPFGFFF